MVELPHLRSIAARVEVIAEAGSTNAMLRELAADVDAWPHLSVLLTDDQTAGRGRLDRQWTAPAGTALAVSVLLRRLPVVAEARGWIPLAAGLAMAEAVADQAEAHTVSVKWPNDVLVDGRKICGILAEATGDAVIVGTGVNTTMTAAQLPVPTATSFAVLGIDVQVDRLLARYLEGLDQALVGLVATGDAGISGLHAAVSARCGTLGQQVRVLLPGDRALEGTAVSLDSEGRLVVREGDALHAVSAGDVVHVRPTGA
ncbi:biotin--[acetyl-CoA-carboxylase] ligase [Microbacterium sp. C5A9]|uniref:biotin--[acetyl-CoA-carboxylase] ligase n=1 Tax=Microbacterium sp. C5A9 TaxID=2736663 RepID=UPI001F51C314|nr:biotin--[acetyl-CoA-carboxylase] ligase [Microbacterium sp. C5A9]MCI1020181.1 biotin--[acetyl-CoA-carboxylase] ligase [Microbacterium sp. C5A9]